MLSWPSAGRTHTVPTTEVSGRVRVRVGFSFRFRFKFRVRVRECERVSEPVSVCVFCVCVLCLRARARVCACACVREGVCLGETLTLWVTNDPRVTALPSACAGERDVCVCVYV